MGIAVLLGLLLLVSLLAGGMDGESGSASPSESSEEEAPWNSSQFNVFGFPLRIDPSAVVLVVLLGLLYGGQGGRMGVSIALMALAVILVSILVHGLGHAFVARSMGLGPVHIVLHGFGGLTQFSKRPSNRQGVLVSLIRTLCWILARARVLGHCPGGDHPGEPSAHGNWLPARGLHQSLLVGLQSPADVSVGWWAGSLARTRAQNACSKGTEAHKAVFPGDIGDHWGLRAPHRLHFCGLGLPLYLLPERSNPDVITVSR